MSFSEILDLRTGAEITSPNFLALNLIKIKSKNKNKSTFLWPKILCIWEKLCQKRNIAGDGRRFAI